MSNPARENLEFAPTAVGRLTSAFAPQGAHGSEACTVVAKCGPYILHELVSDTCAEPLLALVPDVDYLRAAFVVA